jgi:hypothetical protein
VAVESLRAGNSLASDYAIQLGPADETELDECLSKLLARFGLSCQNLVEAAASSTSLRHENRTQHE